MDANKVATGEKAYFSYEINGKKQPLPQGCPPPVLQEPPKNDECKMGYEVGQVISRTVANVVVPVLSEDIPENPFAQEDAFKELQVVKDELSSDNSPEMQEKLKKAIHKYELMVKEFAENKLKCF
jgi:hypothetical protein